MNTNKWSENFDDRPHHRRIFHLGKFNVTLDCFFQSERWNMWKFPHAYVEIPTPWPLGTMLGGVRDNPDVIPIKSAHFRGGSALHLIYSSLANTSPHPKRHFDRSSRFCRAQNCYRQTDRPRFSVCSNRPHIASAAMRPNNN